MLIHSNGGSAGPGTSAPRGVVHVMPRPSTEWATAAACWIGAAEWAAAARRRFGHAWVVTPDAVASPEVVLGYGSEQRIARRRWTRVIPQVVRTAVNDLVAFRVQRKYSDVGERPEWLGVELEFVWQYHHLFHDAGRQLARRHRCPLVSFVEAPRVLEDRRWGVRRPGWARLVERLGERPQLQASDVVLCVSDEVAAEVVRLGVAEQRIVVSPNGVDADRFSPDVSDEAVRRRLGLQGRFVVGWTGSFRRFHGLEQAIEAFTRVHRDDPDARLLLVGDGPERENLEHLVASLGLANAVVFVGAKPYEEVPDYVAAMDATVVTAQVAHEFHYSPLKMREYLASARAVVAPRVGDVGRTVTDGVDALLYEPGDVDRLAEQLLVLRSDPDLRVRLGLAGRELMLATSTRDLQLERLLCSVPFGEAVSRIEAGVSST